MKLSFYAKGDLLVTVPNQYPLIVGQPKRRIGRDFVAGNAETGKPAQYPASKEPWTCEYVPGEAGIEELLRQVRQDKTLWPADQQTAELCELPLVDVVWQEPGVWVEKPSQPVDDSKTNRPRARAAE
jgi:hypothetical protein